MILTLKVLPPSLTDRINYFAYYLLLLSISIISRSIYDNMLKLYYILRVWITFSFTITITITISIYYGFFQQMSLVAIM